MEDIQINTTSYQGGDRLELSYGEHLFVVYTRCEGDLDNVWELKLMLEQWKEDIIQHLENKKPSWQET